MIGGHAARTFSSSWRGVWLNARNPGGYLPEFVLSTDGSNSSALEAVHEHWLDRKCGKCRSSKRRRICKTPSSRRVRVVGKDPLRACHECNERREARVKPRSCRVAVARPYFPDSLRVGDSLGRWRFRSWRAKSLGVAIPRNVFVPILTSGPTYGDGANPA